MSTCQFHQFHNGCNFKKTTVQDGFAQTHWVQWDEIILQLCTVAVCFERQQEICVTQHLVLVHGECHIRWLIHCSTNHMVLELVPVKIGLQDVMLSQSVEADRHK